MRCSFAVFVAPFKFFIILFQNIKLSVYLFSPYSSRTDEPHCHTRRIKQRVVMYERAGGSHSAKIGENPTADI